jgi:hypothetical protein
LGIESGIAGGVGAFAGWFGQTTNLLNVPGLKETFIAVTVWGELVFAKLFENLKELYSDFKSKIRWRLN